MYCHRITCKSATRWFPAVLAALGSATAHGQAVPGAAVPVPAPIPAIDPISPEDIRPPCVCWDEFERIVSQPLLSTAGPLAAVTVPVPVPDPPKNSAAKLGTCTDGQCAEIEQLRERIGPIAQGGPGPGTFAEALQRVAKASAPSKPAAKTACEACDERVVELLLSPQDAPPRDDPLSSPKPRHPVVTKSRSRAEQPVETATQNVTTLRTMAERLEQLANELETGELYEQADALRKQAAELRLSARSLLEERPDVREVLRGARPASVDNRQGNRQRYDVPIRPRASLNVNEPPSNEEVHRALRELNPTAADAVVSRSPNGVRIHKEKIAKSTEPPRDFPLIGAARMHHTRWKCTVQSAGSTSSLPVSTPGDEECTPPQVVFIDQTQLLPCRDEDSE